MESVLAQTMGELELVLVEDPSERSAASVLDALSDPRIRHVRNPVRTSLVEQRNATVALARAPLIAQLDADDVCEPTRLERQLAHVEAHPEIDVLGSHIRAIDHRGHSLGYRAYPTSHEAIVAALPRYNPIANSTTLFRKELFERVRGYRFHGRAEDYELWCRLAAAGARFANLPEPLVRYRVHAAGSKVASFRREIRDTIEVKLRHFRGRLGLRGRARLWAERALLLLPTSLALWLFMRLHYRRG